MEYNQFNIAYLTPEMILHLEGLVNLRLTELVLSNENPNIINMYRGIKIQLDKAK